MGNHQMLLRSFLLSYHNSKLYLLDIERMNPKEVQHMIVYSSHLDIGLDLLRQQGSRNSVHILKYYHMG